MKVPQLPPPPAPAECTKAEIELYPLVLSDLPLDFLDLTQKQQAQVMLKNKADDSTQYLKLRAQALRCAR